MRRAPRSRPSARVTRRGGPRPSGRSRLVAGGRRAGLPETLVQPRRVPPTRPGPPGVAPAAPAAPRAGGLGDQRTGLDAALLGRGGHEGDAAADRLAADDDGTDAGLLADGDGQVAHLVAGGPVDPGDDDAVDRLRGQLAGPARGHLLPQRLDLVAGGLQLGPD